MFLISKAQVITAQIAAAKQYPQQSFQSLLFEKIKWSLNDAKPIHVKKNISLGT